MSTAQDRTESRAHVWLIARRLCAAALVLLVSVGSLLVASGDAGNLENGRDPSAGFTWGLGLWALALLVLIGLAGVALVRWLGSGGPPPPAKYQEPKRGIV